jgi:hypothetical protein
MAAVSGSASETVAALATEPVQAGREQQVGRGGGDQAEGSAGGMTSRLTCSTSLPVPVAFIGSARPSGASGSTP